VFRVGIGIGRTFNDEDTLGRMVKAAHHVTRQRG
jgi:hypothetical protein